MTDIDTGALTNRGAHQGSNASGAEREGGVFIAVFVRLSFYVRMELFSSKAYELGIEVSDREM